MKTIRQILLFLALLRMLWIMAAQLAAMTNSTQKAILAEQQNAANANAIANILGQGGVSPGPPGGAPGVYTPSYESQLSAMGASIISKLNAAGIT